MTAKQIKWASFFIASPSIVVMAVVNALLIRWGLAWWQIMMAGFLSFFAGMWVILVVSAESGMLKENGYEEK